MVHPGELYAVILSEAKPATEGRPTAVGNAVRSTAFIPDSTTTLAIESGILRFAQDDKRGLRRTGGDLRMCLGLGTRDW
jgi:hypothetical protein